MTGLTKQERYDILCREWQINPAFKRQCELYWKDKKDPGNRFFNKMDEYSTTSIVLKRLTQKHCVQEKLFLDVSEINVKEV